MELTKLLRVMKLTAFLFFAACLQASASGHAQGITLKAREMPLEKVFSELKKQTGYVVFYDYAAIRELKSVTLNVKDLPIQQFLRECFKDQPLDFTIEDKTIFVVKKKPEKKADGTAGASPPLTVSGKVVNENGDPVFATLLIKGTKRGIATNQLGDFTLINVEADAVLIVTGVTFETKEVPVNGKSNLGNIIVKLKAGALDEVVVNKGYYNERLKYLTGNVGRVTSKEIERQPVVNPLQALQGRVAGLMITQQNGAPGGPFEVRIRGNNSIASGNNPLYIVDGVPYMAEMTGATTTTSVFFSAGTPNIMSNINPQDIESVDVLKDADATAIYGSRGANGVILITTKKAKAGKATASINASHGFGQVGYFPDLMNKEQYLQYRALAFKTANTAPTNTDVDVNGTWANNPETDWAKKAVGHKAQYSDVQLSFSGGSSNTSYLLNGAWHKETAVDDKQESPYSRRSVMLTVNSSSNDKRFNLQVSGNYSSIKSDMPYTTMIEVATAYPNSPGVYDAEGNLNWADDWANPFARYEVRNRLNTSSLIGTITMSYKVWKSITAKITTSYTEQQLNDNQALKSTWFRPSLGITAGRSGFTNNKSTTWIAEPQLSYDARIAGGNFAATAGATVQENKFNSGGVQGSGYNDNNLLGSLAAAGTIEKLTHRKTQYRYRGIYVRLNYVFKEKYVVNATARTDGSSRFAPDYRFRNFGAVGGAWLFGSENFIKRMFPFVSFGKLRATYGITGGDQFEDYRYLDLYSYTTFATLYQATQGMFPGNLYNPDLVWERNKKLELGMELGLLRDRINLSASWYRNRSGNQIVQYPLPATTGFTSVYSNLPAVVQNAGWEFTLNSTIVNNRNFKWKTTFNLTDQRNKLVSFPDLQKINAYRQRLVIGEPLSNAKRYKYAGVDPLVGLYTFYTASGAITFAPVMATDRIVNTNDDPELFGGFGNNFTYKGFELELFFQFCKKGKKNPLFMANAPPGHFNRASYYNWSPEVLNAWQKPGDITNVQRLSPLLSTENNTYVNAQASDLNWVDASYAKLKTLVFGWQLTPQLKKTLHLQNGRLYIQCQNVFTITRFKGWDPEPNQDQLTLPPLRTVTAGIQLTF